VAETDQPKTATTGGFSKPVMPEAATERKASAPEGAAETAAPKPDGIDRTTDPVRIYMREMSVAQPLIHQEEINIAKRIEKGLRRTIYCLAHCPAIDMPTASHLCRDALGVKLPIKIATHDMQRDINIEQAFSNTQEENQGDSSSVRLGTRENGRPMRKGTSKCTAACAYRVADLFTASTRANSLQQSQTKSVALLSTDQG